MINGRRNINKNIEIIILFRQTKQLFGAIHFDYF